MLTRTWTGLHYERAGCEYRSKHPMENPKDLISAWVCPAIINYFKKERTPEIIYAAPSPSESVSAKEVPRIDALGLAESL